MPRVVRCRPVECSDRRLVPVCRVPACLYREDADAFTFGGVRHASGTGVGRRPQGTPAVAGSRSQGTDSLVLARGVVLQAVGAAGPGSGARAARRRRSLRLRRRRGGGEETPTCTVLRGPSDTVPGPRPRSAAGAGERLSLRRRRRRPCPSRAPPRPARCAAEAARRLHPAMTRGVPSTPPTPQTTTIIIGYTVHNIVTLVVWLWTNKT